MGVAADDYTGDISEDSPKPGEEGWVEPTNPYDGDEESYGTTAPEWVSVPIERKPAILPQLKSEVDYLNEKDRELLITDEPINYDAPANAYLGGYFGDNPNDFIQVFIYDVNDNFLESGTVQGSDYYHWNAVEGIKIKTGTILRKMGYDRGRFKVKYNFLRKLAGSNETIITDVSGNVVNGDIDTNEIGKSLFIKENKYFIHEISNSRTELRLIPQTIRDVTYLRNFYNLHRRTKTLRSDESDDAKLSFYTENTNQSKGDSKTLQFENSDVRLSRDMIGGKVIFPNAIITGYVPSGISHIGGNGTSGIHGEIITEDLDALQAKFEVSAQDSATHVANSSGGLGDLTQHYAYNAFRGLDNQGIEDDVLYLEDPVLLANAGTLNQNSIRAKGTRYMQNIYDTHDPDWAVVKYNHPKDYQNNVIIVTIKSTSTLPDVTTVYEWEFSGWRNWKSGASNSGDFNPLEAGAPTSNPETYYDDGAVNVCLMTGMQDDDNVVWAQPNANVISNMGAICTVPGPDDRAEGAPRPMVKLRFAFTYHSDGARMGIKLRVIQQNLGRSSYIHIPCFLETQRR